MRGTNAINPTPCIPLVRGTKSFPMRVSLGTKIGFTPTLAVKGIGRVYVRRPLFFSMCRPSTEDKNHMNHPFHASSRAEANATLRDSGFLSRPGTSNSEKKAKIKSARRACPACPASPAAGNQLPPLLNPLPRGERRLRIRRRSGLHPEHADRPTIGCEPPPPTTQRRLKSAATRTPLLSPPADRGLPLQKLPRPKSPPAD